MVKHNRKQQDISIIMITDGYDNYTMSSLKNYKFRWYWCNLNDTAKEDFYKVLNDCVNLDNIDINDVFNVRDIAKW